MSNAGGLLDDDYIRRRVLFTNIYKNIESWIDLINIKGPDFCFIDVGDETIYIGDIFVGYETLNDKQKRMFRLYCLEDKTVVSVKQICNSRDLWTDPTSKQLHKIIEHMMAEYDKCQNYSFMRDRKRLARHKIARHNKEVLEAKKFMDELREFEVKQQQEFRGVFV